MIFDAGATRRCLSILAGMTHRRLVAIVGLAVTLGAAQASAQTPQPFPRPPVSRGVLPPGATTPAKTPPAGQATPPAGVQPPASAQPTPAAAAPATNPGGAPDEATLGVPLYPGAQFLTAFDAGKGQRYFLYGTPASFSQVVTFYRGSLKTKGDLIFEQPATHAFDVGRFREEAMVFPPGVTVKDHTFGGSQGYLHVGPNAQSQRFPTVIQIVPPPPAAPAVRR